MAGKIEYYKNDSWIDITDYIESCPLIPYITRNRDVSLRADSISITVATTIKDLLSDPSFKFQDNESIRISNNGTFLFGGYVEDCIYDYREMSFEVSVRSSLLNLDNILIEYDSLHTLFADSSEWWHYKDVSWTTETGVVGIPWMLKCMFLASGLDLNIDAISESTLFTRTPGIQPGFDPAVNIKYKHLFIIEEMLWCINQSIVCRHEDIDSSLYDFNINKVTCWSLIKDLFSYLNLYLKQTDIETFEAVFMTDNFSPTDDNTFELSEKILRKQNEWYGSRVSYTYHNQLAEYKLAYNVEAPITPNTDYTSGQGSNSINVLRNFVIYFSDAENRENKYNGFVEMRLWDAIIDESANAYSFIIGNETDYANFNISANKVKEQILAVEEKNILTIFEETFKTVIEHSVDLEWNNSEIRQEVYL